MNAVKTTFLLGLLTGLVMLVGAALGGRHGAALAFVFAAAVNFASYWFSDKMVLAAYRAKPLDPGQAPELWSIIQELATEAHIPLPRLYLIDADTPNAFATGRSPNHAAVAVTRGIMQLCSREELKGVIGHELSHVVNRDILTSSIAATLAGAVMMLASWARWAAIFGMGEDEERRDGMIGFLVMAFLAPLAATLIQLAISRTREYQADAGGARLTHNPLYLANALRKLEFANQQLPLNAGPATAHLFIVNPLTGGGVMRLFSTHPPIEERIRRLEQMAGKV
ncbi:MAG: zinc metalloprotease HtpX [Deltaproteobacteria bacterium]|jgi:heat shock protein HtpX|nr:zinc metalloprotease HtpX [Deltaproteobacteria bacterium]